MLAFKHLYNIRFEINDVSILVTPRCTIPVYFSNDAGPLLDNAVERKFNAGHTLWGKGRSYIVCAAGRDRTSWMRRAGSHIVVEQERIVHRV